MNLVGQTRKNGAVLLHLCYEAQSKTKQSDRGTEKKKVTWCRSLQCAYMGFIYISSLVFSPSWLFANTQTNNQSPPSRHILYRSFPILFCGGFQYVEVSLPTLYLILSLFLVLSHPWIYLLQIWPLLLLYYLCQSFTLLHHHWFYYQKGTRKVI